MEDLFDDIDSSLINVNYDENRDKSFRRYCYTWNNPFFDSEIFEEVDISDTDLRVDFDHYDLHNLKTDFNKDFFDFRFIKYVDYKTEEIKVIERPFFKDANSIRSYIVNFSTFKYSCFQIEKGGNCETVHIQGFVTFRNPMTWSTFKNYFPCSHFNKCISNNSRCKKYCSKEETRIDGPFEDGEFSEERSRSDIKQFLELVSQGASDSDLQELYPSLFLREFNKIDKIRNKNIFSKFKNIRRSVNVTYIYGPPRVGKTTHIVNKYGYGNFYTIDTYKIGPFDNYNGENVIVFDEFESQFSIDLFNKLIDSHPVQLPCRFENKWACYTDVYIISNSSLNEQYNDSYVKPVQREAFLSRIHNIIRFDSFGKLHYEKKTDDNLQYTLIDDEDIIDIFG